MRIGQNPGKTAKTVAKPANITVAIITHIPFLTGYYEQSLNVLQTCLGSLWDNTDLPVDLMVFDNASCQPVREYLTGLQTESRIQYLILSDKNYGVTGAWNFIFQAAQGEFIVFADSDIYFYPGWLSKQIAVLEAFPNAGMVTGIPMWSPPEFSTSTVVWAQKNPDVRVESGRLLPLEDFWKHARSLGTTEEEAQKHYKDNMDTVLHIGGAKYYSGAGHFQFASRKSILSSVLPLPFDRPMGNERQLDIAINKAGFLRLSTSEWLVQHLGNRLDVGVLQAGKLPTESQYEAGAVQVGRQVGESAGTSSKAHRSEARLSKARLSKARRGWLQTRLAQKVLYWMYNNIYKLINH